MGKGARELIQRHGAAPFKTSEQMTREWKEAAMALPVETRRTFWAAMREGKNVGQARMIAGIDDVMIAAQLVILCHEEKTHHRPLDVSEIV